MFSSYVVYPSTALSRYVKYYWIVKASDMEKQLIQTVPSGCVHLVFHRGCRISFTSGIAIQDYQTESWTDLVHLWKYTNLHIIHVIRHVNPEKLDNEWITALGEKVSLKAMITDYLRHFELHLGEIEELINQE